MFDRLSALYAIAVLFLFCFGGVVFTVDLFAMIEIDPGTLHIHVQKAELI